MSKSKPSNTLFVILQRCGRQLVITGLLYKVLAFVLLTPLIGVLFRALLALSGRSVLADQDILHFFLGPLGWTCAVAVAALWLTIAALEQAALLAVLTASAFKITPSVLAALQFAFSKAIPVFQVTLRMVAWALLVAVPFLAGLGLVYVGLLSRFDINFYLTEKPPELWFAVALAGPIVLGWSAVMIRLVTGWFFALPLILFETVPPSEALAESKRRAVGNRRDLAVAVVVWALASLMVSSAGIGLVVWLGRSIVPAFAGSLWALAIAAGGMLIVWAIVNLAINLVSMIAFAAMLAHLYRIRGKPKGFDLDCIRSLKGDGPTPLRITAKRVAVAAIAGVVLAAAVGWFAVNSVPMQDNTQVTAHRGASGSAPENTLAAVEEAINQGADWVEIDVQQTIDGQVVVFHDSDFMKLAGDPRTIWSVTGDALKDIDVGSHFNSDFADQRVPLLSDVLAKCKNRIGVNIELKYYGQAEQLEKQLASQVAELVKTSGMESEIVVMSLKSDAVKQMKLLQPDWQVGLLAAVAAGDLASAPADFLAVNAGMADFAFVNAAHKNGKQVWVWTVNDAFSMSTMIGRGVDNLITDEPALARTVLRERAKLGASDRILLHLAEWFGLETRFGEQ